MMIDDDTLRHLLRIYDDLVSAMQMVDEKHDIEVSSRLIPLVDEHTHLLIEAEKNKSNERHENAETCRRLSSLLWSAVISLSCPLFYAVFLRTESD